jgi:hypothetical protein
MTATQTLPFQNVGTAQDRLAAGCAICFIIVLAIGAYWDPAIRVLHVFEAIPYGIAAIFCLRHSKAGYMLGAASGGFWLWMAGTLTTFVRNGFERVAMLIQLGHVDRWDVFMAAPAAVATGGLVLCSLWGYFRLGSKSARDVLGFLGAFAAVAAYFLVLFWLFAPQYLRMFAPLFSRSSPN